jgi:hypothetical protein
MLLSVNWTLVGVGGWALFGAVVLIGVILTSRSGDEDEGDR